MAIELYKTNEYPVIVGNTENSVALCTLWQDPAKIASPGVKDTFAIIGTLRSPFGLNIILYNLALNPGIRELIIWGPDRLSNTDIGLIGKRALLNLWRHGVDQDGTIGETGYALVHEINPQVVNIIIQHVRLRDLSMHDSLPLSQLKSTMKAPKAYMEMTRFPDFKVTAPSIWPSEGMIFLIRQKTGAEAFLQLIDRIWKYGSKTPIDTGGEVVKELRGPVVVVEGENYEEISLPAWLLGIPELGMSREQLEDYRRNQFSPEAYRREIYPGIFKFERPPDYSYVYAELLYAFPRPHEIDGAVRLLMSEAGYEAAKRFIIENSRVGKDRLETFVYRVDSSALSLMEKLTVLLEALIPPTDQIANVIDRIRRKPDDLDKEVVLWDPRFHSTLEGGRPCLMKLSFSLRDAKLDVMAFFRSHDILGAWFHNYYGIAGLLKDIAKETGVSPGKIVIESESAHLYQRHWNTVQRLLEAEKENKPPRMVFNLEHDADPRGNVIITTTDRRINLKLLSPQGDQVVLELEGKTAHELLYKLKHIAPLSRLDHAAFVGSELAKAEAAIRIGIPYEQDKPLRLSQVIEE